MGRIGTVGAARQINTDCRRWYGEGTGSSRSMGLCPHYFDSINKELKRVSIEQDYLIESRGTRIETSSGDHIRPAKWMESILEGGDSATDCITASTQSR